MNTNSKRLKIYVTMLVVFTGLACALRTLAYLNDFDFSVGFFKDTTMITVANAAIIATSVLMLTYLFTTSKVSLRASFATSSTYVPTGMLAIATLFVGVGVLIHLIQTSKYPLLSAEALSSPFTIISLLVALTSLLSAAHCFFNVFITESRSTLRAYFSIGTVAFLSLYAILLYLDESLAINDQSKITNQMAYILAAIFFLYESRISLGREKWRAYAAFGLIAASVCAYSSIPALVVYYINGRLVSSSADAISLTSIDEYALTLALFIFITARLIITVKLPENKPNAMITAMRKYFNAREKDVKESTARLNEGFASKQLSVFDVFGGDVPEQAEPQPVPEEAPKAKKTKKKEPEISDDAIYESIFGKLPTDNDKAEEKTEEKAVRKAEKKTEAPKSVPKPEKKTEEIAEEILNTVAKAESDAKKAAKSNKVKK